MAKKTEKISVKVKAVWPNRVIVTTDGKTIRIPHNVDLPEEGDSIEVGEDWAGKFTKPEAPKPSSDAAK